MENKINVSISPDKNKYSSSDPIILECEIRNLGKTSVTLIWDNPVFKTWISGGIKVDFYG